MKKQNQSKNFIERYANSKRDVITKITQALTSSWSIGAIIAAVSAWTASILYV